MLMPVRIVEDECQMMVLLSFEVAPNTDKGQWEMDMVTVMHDESMKTCKLPDELFDLPERAL